MAANELPDSGLMTPTQWLKDYLETFPEVDVPCGTCFACCTKGAADHMELDEKGDCVHLIGGKCSIYAHRPVECRAFDCRAFFFCNVDPKGHIGEAVKRWTAEYKTPADHQLVKKLSKAVDRDLHPADGVGLVLHEYFRTGSRSRGVQRDQTQEHP